MFGGRRPRTSARERLVTLHLYLELQNVHAVAKRLGIENGAVRARLLAMGVQLRPIGSSAVRVEDCNDPAFLAELVERLEIEASVEHEGDVKRPSSGAVSAADKLRTLELYERHGSFRRVSEELGISPTAVRDRLRRLGLDLPSPPQRYLAEVNDPARLAAIKRRLRAEIEVQGAAPPRGQAQLTAAEQLWTVELYLEMGSVAEAARRIGIPTAALRYRLERLGIRTTARGQRNPGVYSLNSRAFIAELLRSLRQAVVAEERIRRAGQIYE